MPSWKAWVQRTSGLIKRGSKEQAEKERLQKKGRKCFERGNICDRSKNYWKKAIKNGKLKDLGGETGWSN
jgi:hypothetical protein